MADPVSLVFVDEDDLVGLRDRLYTASVLYVRAAIGEHQMRRRDAFLSALVPACALAHHVPYRHRIGRQEGASVEVGHVNASLHQDVRLPHLGILPQRTIGRTALLTLKAGRFKVPLLGRTIELFAFAWSVNRLLSAQRARSRIIAFTLRLRSAAARPLTRTIRFWFCS